MNVNSIMEDVRVHVIILQGAMNVYVMLDTLSNLFIIVQV